jgi:hypothetical protein
MLFIARLRLDLAVNRHLPMGMDIERKLLSAQRKRPTMRRATAKRRASSAHRAFSLSALRTHRGGTRRSGRARFFLAAAQ